MELQREIKRSLRLGPDVAELARANYVMMPASSRSRQDPVEVDDEASDCAPILVADAPEMGARNEDNQNAGQNSHPPEAQDWESFALARRDFIRWIESESQPGEEAQQLITDIAMKLIEVGRLEDVSSMMHCLKRISARLGIESWRVIAAAVQDDIAARIGVSFGSRSYMALF